MIPLLMNHLHLYFFVLTFLFFQLSLFIALVVFVHPVRDVIFIEKIHHPTITKSRRDDILFNIQKIYRSS
jgi:hypothetical protein